MVPRLFFNAFLCIGDLAILQTPNATDASNLKNLKVQLYIIIIIAHKPIDIPSTQCFLKCMGEYAGLVLFSFSFLQTVFDKYLFSLLLEL